MLKTKFALMLMCLSVPLAAKWPVVKLGTWQATSADYLNLNDKEPVEHRSFQEILKEVFEHDSSREDDLDLATSLYLVRVKTYAADNMSFYHWYVFSSLGNIFKKPNFSDPKKFQWDHLGDCLNPCNNLTIDSIAFFKVESYSEQPIPLKFQLEAFEVVHFAQFLDQERKFVAQKMQMLLLEHSFEKETMKNLMQLMQQELEKEREENWCLRSDAKEFRFVAISVVVLMFFLGVFVGQVA